MTKTGKDLALLTFCINHQPLSPETKTIKAYVCSATNATAFPRRLKIAPATLSAIAGYASTAFPASLLSASVNLSNNFFQTPSSFGVEPAVPSPPPKAPVMVSISVNFEVLFKSYLVCFVRPYRYPGTLTCQG